MKESLRVFCWDCNGTLEEGSEYALTEAINESLAKRGIKRTVSVKDVFGFFGGGVDKLAREVSGVTIPREELEELTFAKAEKYVRPVEGAEEVLAEVRRRGDMNVVVSGSGARALKRYLDVTELMPYVNSYIGVDTLQIIYSKHGWDIKSGGVDVEKVRALLMNADHSYVDRVVMIGDSHVDMRAAYVTNELLYRNGKRRVVRPILFRPPNRRERARTTLRQKLYDNTFYFAIGYKKARTLREAMEMGYDEKGVSYLRRHPLSTSTVISGLFGGIAIGTYFALGESYWYLRLIPYSLLPILGAIGWNLDKRIDLYREEPARLRKILDQH